MRLGRGGHLGAAEASLGVALLGALLVAVGAGCKAPAPPADAIQRGRELYLRGVSLSGREVRATMAGGEVLVPAAALPCASCHGRDGRGRPEGGMFPSNIRWEALSRPYAIVEGSGRRRPPYTERLLGRALTMGVDSGGQRLQGAMPLYQLAREDVDDLVAWLKAMADEAPPGVGEEGLRVGTLVEAEGPLAEEGRAARAALGAFFEELNRQGGLYGRQVELRAVELPAAPAERLQVVRAFLEGERPLALVGALLSAPEGGLAALLEEQRVSLVGVLTPPPPGAAQAGGPLFYLSPGLAEQGRALVAQAARRHAGARVALLHTGSEAARRAVRELVAACREAGLGEVLEREVAPEGLGKPLVAELSRRRVRVVLSLEGAGLGQRLWQATSRARWRPLILSAGQGSLESLLQAPPALAGRLHAALAVLPSDFSPQARERYQALATSYRLPVAHVLVQLSALAAAELLLEGLERSGRRASREALAAALEGVRGLETGLTPPLTYGRSRRIGALGAYVVSVDPRQRRFTPVGGWSTVE